MPVGLATASWVTYAPDGLADGAASPRRARSPAKARMTTGLANALLAQLPLAVAVIGPDLRLLYWNEQAVGYFGAMPKPDAAMPSLTASMLGMTGLTPSQRDKFVDFVTTQIANADAHDPDSSFRLTLGRGQRILLQVRALGAGRWMLVIDDGRLLAAAGNGNAAQGDPWLDSLTGLSNRRHFNDVLRDKMQDADAAGRCTLLLIDLDRFKPVNETLGHAVGDAMLCLVARRLRHETREDDLLVRLGGDEFVILMANGASAEALAPRVIAALSRPYIVEGHAASVGASIGIAGFPQHGATPDELMRHAELALADAKTAGGGTWRMSAQGMTTGSRPRHTLESDLRNALPLGQLSVVYQPHFNIRTQTITGFEALLRWTHPTHGVVSPSEFIPIAEEIGCIAALGDFILTAACAQAMRWPAPLSVAVNVSARQIQDSESLFQAVRSALHASGLAPSRLELEITESALLPPADHALEVLRQLHATGIRITLDDFGIGYSSLGQLRSLPFHRIKLARSLVAGIGRHDDTPSVIRTIAAAGGALGMAATAKGVETPGQAAFVKASGCTDMQGYLVGRPVPASGIASLLRQNATAPQPAVALT